MSLVHIQCITRVRVPTSFPSERSHQGEGNPYVEVPDHSDAWMCAKDSGVGGGGGGEHSSEGVMVARVRVPISFPSERSHQGEGNTPLCRGT